MRHLLVCSAILSLLTACAPQVSGEAAGQRPHDATDEAGLWLLADEAEATLKHSRRLVGDKELTAYVGEVACRVAGPHCASLRVYVVRSADVGVTAAANGMLQITTGTLLRIRNEAQLAALLAHEIAHFAGRHQLARWRLDRDARAVGMLLGLAIAGGGGAAFGTSPVARLAYHGHQEHEADGAALRMLAEAGYAPMEAARLWQTLAAEDGSGNTLQTLHADATARVPVIRQTAATLASSSHRVAADEFRSRLRLVWRQAIEDELRQHRFAHTLAMLDQLTAQTADDADILYFYGEFYRSRNEAGDLDQAIKYLERAVLGDVPPEAWRGLGLSLRKNGGGGGRSVDALRRYLAGAPDAPDRALIESYIQGGI